MLRTKNENGMWQPTERFEKGLDIIGKDIRNVFNRLIAAGYSLEEAQVLVLEESTDVSLWIALGHKGE